MDNFFLCKILLLLSLIAASHQKCSSSEMEEMKKCASAFNETKMMFQKYKGESILDPEVAGKLAESCKKSLECLPKIECEEISKVRTGTGMVCESVGLSVTMTPCFKKFSNTLALSSDKYPCLKENNINVNASDFKCKLYGVTAHDCVGPIIKDVCGENMKNDFEKLRTAIRPMLKNCSN